MSFYLSLFDVVSVSFYSWFFFFIYVFTYHVSDYRLLMYNTPTTDCTINVKRQN